MKWKAILVFCLITGFNLSAQEIFQLIKKGDPKSIIAFINQNGCGQLNLTNKLGFSPLEMSVIEGNQQAARAMLRFAPDIGVEGRINYLLILAVLGFKVDEVEALLKVGADINSQTRGGLSPLMISVMVDPSAKLSSLLLGQGANVFYEDRDGHDALWYATSASVYIDNLRLLLEYNAIDAYLEQGDRLLYHAFLAENNDKSFSLILGALNHADWVDAKGRSLLQNMIYAYDPTREASILKLMKAGANLNWQDEGGWTPLFYAAGHTFSNAIITYLLDNGADMRQVDAKGSTAFMSVIKNGSLPMIRSFLEHGADADENDSTGRSAYYYFDSRQFVLDNRGAQNDYDWILKQF